MLKTALLIAILISIPWFAWADSNWEFDRPYTLKCSEGGQEQMNICLGEEYQKIDNKLNALYMQLINSLENPKKLKEAQKEWIRFRNLDCDYTTSGILKEGITIFTHKPPALLITLKNESATFRSI